VGATEGIAVGSKVAGRVTTTLSGVAVGAVEGIAVGGAEGASCCTLEQAKERLISPAIRIDAILAAAAALSPCFIDAVTPINKGAKP